MPAPIPNNARSTGRVAAAEAPAPPEPGFLEGFGAAFTAARDDQFGRLEDAKVDAYAPIITSLNEMGLDASNYLLPVRSGPQVNFDGVWGMVAEARRRDPKALPDLPATQAEFDVQWQEQFRKRAEATEQLAGRAGWATRLAGGFAGAMTDPVNIATLPIGGAGKTIAMRVLTEGLANAAVEAAQQPLINMERQRQGRAELTGEQMGYNVAGAAAFGAAFRGGIEAAPHVGPQIVRAVTANRARLPQALRDRWDAHLLNKANPLDDPMLLADISEAIVGRENMSELDVAAGVVARGDGQVDAASPFRDNGAGAELHDTLASEAFRAALDANPLTRTTTSRAALTRAMPPVRAADIGEGAQGRFMGLVRGAESDGDDTARNLRSSATGRYQFTRDTWLAYYKRRFGAGGLSDAEILAKRGDGNLQDALMGDLTADNAAALRRAGHAANEGNLYLAHFAGEAGARKVLDAEPDAPIERILGEKAVKANPFLKGKSAAWVIDWAHRKMGSAPHARSVEMRDGAGGMEEAATMQAAVDRALGRAAQLAEADRAARAGGDDIDDALGNALVPIERDGLPEGGEPIEARAAEADAPSAEVLALLPRLREVVAGKRSLNRVAEMAEEMGVPEADLRTGLGEMIREGRITVNRKTGNFMRKAKAPDGPEDVLDFIARNGGLRDDEGHGLGLRGVSARERRELHPAAVKNVQRRREGGGKRDWQRMTRRNGPLLRHEGRSVDAVGELLWEAGYLRGRDSERPTTREVLDFLEQRINGGEKAFPIGNAPTAEAPSWEAAWEAIQQRDALDDFLREWEAAGNDTDLLDGDDLVRAAQLWRENPEAGVGAAAERAIIEQFHAVSKDTLDATDDALYDIPYDFGTGSLPDGRIDGPRGAGPATERGPAGARGEAGGEAPGVREDGPTDGQALADLAPEARSPFIDADGVAARQQADSLVHDARAEIERQADFAEPTQEQARISLERQGEGRIKGKVAQKPPGSDGGLFDVQARDLTFRFDDEGAENSIADLLDGIDAEEAELKNIRDCM